MGLIEYAKPFQGKGMLDVFMITVALMIGTAGLPHIIVRFYTVPSVRAARYSAGWALLFIALLYTTAPAIAVFAKYNLINELNGKTPAQVQQLDWVKKWEETKLLKFNDVNGDGVLEMTGDPKTTEIEIDRDIIVLSTPEVAKLSPIVVALVAAGGLAAALSTAAGLLLVISSSLAHDIYYRLINPNATEARRLLIGRIMIFVAVVFAGYFGIKPPGFVAQVVAFAFGLAAASFFPVIILGIFDKRMNKEGAIVGMILGMGFTHVLHHRQPIRGHGPVVLQRQLRRHRDIRSGDQLRRLLRGLPSDPAAAAAHPGPRGIRTHPAWFGRGYRALLAL